jgi:hypothetical protein
MPPLEDGEYDWPPYVPRGSGASRSRRPLPGFREFKTASARSRSGARRGRQRTMGRARAVLYRHMQDEYNALRSVRRAAKMAIDAAKALFTAAVSLVGSSAQGNNDAASEGRSGPATA